MGIWRSLESNENPLRRSVADRAARKRRRKARPAARREMKIERFEDRMMLAGPQLISIIPDAGDVLLAGQTRDVAPRELTFRFDQGQVIDPATYGGIQITRSGGDGLFSSLSTTNDVPVIPGYVGVGSRLNEVVLRFAETLPDDLYRITIVGVGPSALANTETQAGPRFVFNDTTNDGVDNGVNYSQFFRLDLGPQVLAIVPEPVGRSGAALAPAFGVVDVYFDQALDTTSAQNTSFYQLIRTNNTAITSDDGGVPLNPTSAVYVPAENRVRLTFTAGNAPLSSLGTGAFRLRIGNTDQPLLAPLAVGVPGEGAANSPGDTFATAMDVATIGAQTRVLSSTIDTMPFNPGLIFPGGGAEIGHRNIPVEAHGGGGSPDGAAPVITYNFPDVYGNDPVSGQPLHNQILTNENQMQRTREIFQLYSYYAGVQFVESSSQIRGGASLGIVTGDVRVLAVTNPPVGGIAGGGLAIMNGSINWGNSEYGGGWFTTAMHEIGHLLGLGHAYELPPVTIQGGAPELASGASGEQAYPGETDIIHLQSIFHRDSKDIDLYKFLVAADGTLRAETMAERQAPTSALNSVLTLYNEISVLQVPANGGAGMPDTQSFTITNDAGGGPKTFEFTRDGRAPIGTNIAINYTASTSVHDLVVVIANAVNGQWPNVRAEAEVDRVALQGPITVNSAAAPALTATIRRDIISRNDDYFSQDSYLELDLKAGRYFVGVTSTGNTEYDPNVPDSGYGGTTQGAYDLRLNFRAATVTNLVDAVALAGAGLNVLGGDAPKALDGDLDGKAGGTFNFWFDVGNTIWVDKIAPVGGDGSLASPYRIIERALAAANSRIIAPTTAPASMDTNTFVVNDGINPPLTFEFDNNGSWDPSHIRLQFVTGDSATVLAGKIRAAINLQSSGTFEVTASDSGGQVNLAGTRLDASTNTFNDPFIDVRNTPALLGAARIVRIVGNGGADNNLATPADAMPYLIGYDDSIANRPALADGFKFEVPQGVTVMIEAGAVFKMGLSVIDVGSSSQGIDRSRGVLQVLGTPTTQVVFTSIHDGTIGGTTDVVPRAPRAGDFGGVVFRDDSDLESQAIFKNIVNQATIRYGGGNVQVDGVEAAYNPVHLVTARPTVTNNTIYNGQGGAISANPNSFEDTKFDGAAFTLDYDRVGPEVNGNRLISRQPFVLTAVGGVTITDGTTFVVNNTRFEFNKLGSFSPTNVEVPITNAMNATAVAAAIRTAVNNANIGVRATATGAAVSLANATIVRPNAPLTVSQRIDSNTSNGLVVRTGDGGVITDTLDVSARFDDADIVHILTESLLIQGTPGGPLNTTARTHARLDVDPGVVTKLLGARIEVQMGATFIAEAESGRQAIFTSLNDDRYGGSGTFDSNGDQQSPTPTAAAPGNWAGIYFAPTSRGSIDRALITYAGGSSNIAGQRDNFNAIEIRQADVRIVNSSLENNAGGQATSERDNLLSNRAATIYVLDAAPVLVNNTFRNNQGAAIDVSANSFKATLVADPGRSTGKLEAYEQFGDNRGPLVRLNRIGNVAANVGAINGMVVRGATLNVASVWDDVDIVHVVQSEIVVSNFHTQGGLRLQSSSTESLVVKLAGASAGFTATGVPLDINDRVGGSVQIVGTPGHPVVLTALSDDTVGAGLTPDDAPANNTDNAEGAVIVIGGSGPVFIEGGDLEEHGNFNAASGQNEGGWKFMEQALNFTYGDSLNAAGSGVLVIGTDQGTNAGDAIQSAVNALALTTQPGITATFVQDAQISTVNFSQFKVIFVGSDAGDTFGGIDDNELALLTARKADIQTFVNNTGGGLMALTQAAAAAPYSWLELPAPFVINTNVNGSEQLFQTPALAAAGFTITDQEINNNNLWHNSFTGPPGFNNLEVWVTSASGEFVALGLPAGSTGIGGTGSTPGEWRSVRLDQYSNDRNVEVVNELEKPYTGGFGINDTQGAPQALGELAADAKSGDENRRLGFQVHGFVSLDDTTDVDVYTFRAKAGTEVWVDLDYTSMALDTVVELVQANGTVVARSNDSVNETAASLATLLPGNQARVMQRDEFVSDTYPAANRRDYWTTNPRDAGLRVVLPGTVGQTLDYYVRVRSYGGSAASLNNLKGGVSQGEYQLQVRLRELDELPGSTVRFADLRFGTNGVEVFGLPRHSPLLADSGETTADHSTSGAAQDLGNLLTSDQNAISVGGNLSANAEVDWYRFNINHELIQSVVGFNDGRKTWATTFDIDYADGLQRADTVLSIFDSTGRLVFVGRDSNIAEDQPKPPTGDSSTDLSRGSFGVLDPYIGSVQLPEGTYLAAISTNRSLPRALNATFTGAAAQQLVRLEPVNSVQRLIEDHIGRSGGMTATPPAQSAFTGNTTSVAGIASLNAYATPFTLSDVTLFVNERGPNGRFYTVDAMTGAVEADLGIAPGQVEGYHDIAMRNDGRLFGLTTGQIDATSGNYNQISTGDGSIVPGFGGDDGIITYAPDNTPRDRFFPNDDLGTGIQFEALAYVQNGAPENRRLFAVGTDPRPLSVAQGENVFYELDPNSGRALSKLNLPSLPTDPPPANEESFQTDLTVITADATDMPTLLDPSITDRGDLRDGQAFVLERSTASITSTKYEYDGGVEISFGGAEEASSFRDGMFFYLDGRRFEFEGGPVIVAPAAGGNAMNDGDYFTIRDNTDFPINHPEIVFEFDQIAGPGANPGVAPGHIAIPFTKNPPPNFPAFTTQGELAANIRTAINSVAANLTTVAIINPDFPERVVLIEDRATVEVPTNDLGFTRNIDATIVTRRAIDPVTSANDIQDEDTFTVTRQATAPPHDPTLVNQAGVSQTFEFDSGRVISFGAATNANAFRDGQSFDLNGRTFEFDSGPVLIAGSGIAFTDGDVLTIGDGANFVNFVFDTDNSVMEDATTRQIAFTGGESFDAMASLIVSEINDPAFPLTTVATVPAGSARISLRLDASVSFVSGGLTQFGAYGFASGNQRVPFEETDSLAALQLAIKTVVDATPFVVSGAPATLTAGFGRNLMNFVSLGSGASDIANFSVNTAASGGNLTVATGDNGITDPINFIRIPYLFNDTATDIANRMQTAVDTYYGQAIASETVSLPAIGLHIRNNSAAPSFTAPFSLTTVAQSSGTIVEGDYDPIPPANTTLIPFEEIDSLRTPPYNDTTNLALVPPVGLLQQKIQNAVNGFFANGRVVASFIRERMAFVGGETVLTNFQFDFDGIDHPLFPGVVTTNPAPINEVLGATEYTHNGVSTGAIRIPFLLTELSEVIRDRTVDAINAQFMTGLTLISAAPTEIFPTLPEFPEFRPAFTVTGATSVDFTGVEPPFETRGAGGPGGRITGMASTDSGNLFAVTDLGGLYQINYSLVPGNPQPATLTFVDTSADQLLGIRFTGLTIGPPSLTVNENPLYKDLFFATAEDTFTGATYLYCFNTGGVLQNVFPPDALFPTGAPRITLGVSNIAGVAFSSLDFNLFHVTNRRGGDIGAIPADDGHGIPRAPDLSRQTLNPDGGASYYFGLEDPESPNTITAQPGAFNYETKRLPAPYNTQPTAYNTYDMPGGAYGSLTTNTFSLEDYSRFDKPTLYFNYFLQTENRNSDNIDRLMRDSVRVFISADGTNWSMLATNNSLLADDSNDLTTELPSYLTASSNTGSGDSRQRIQELHENTGPGGAGSWRQARVDLGDFAGLKNLRFRFDFSTAGDISDPNQSAIRNYGIQMPGDGFGDFTGTEFSREKGLRNHFEGFYLDDLIVGFAERGEMVTHAAVDTNFVTVPQNPDPTDPAEQSAGQFPAGAYQLEIRRGQEYGATVDPNASPIRLFRSFDTNDRLTQDYTLEVGVSATLAQAPGNLTVGQQLTFNFADLIPSGDTGGTLRIEVTGDMEESNEFLDVLIGPFSFLQQFVTGGREQQASVVTINLTAVQMGTLTASGAFTVTVTPSPQVANIRRIAVQLDYAGVVDGQNFEISDGLKKVTFEFDRNGTVVQTATRRAVNFLLTDTAATLAAKIVAAVNAAQTTGLLNVSASSLATGNRVNLHGARGVSNIAGVSAGVGSLSDEPADPFGTTTNDTLAKSMDTGLTSASRGTFTDIGRIGDNILLNLNPTIDRNGSMDVDMVRVQGDAGERIRIDIDTTGIGSALDSVVRLFDAAGNQVAFSDDDPAPGETAGLDSYIDFTVTTPGLYYVSVSGFNNIAYDPNVEGSALPGFYSTGQYNIMVTVGPTALLPTTRFDLRGDENMVREQGAVILQSNKFTNILQNAILVDSGPRQGQPGDGNANLTHQGSTRVLPTPQPANAQLATSVVIMNNVISGSGDNGILFSGDASTDNRSAVPFGRIINNTIYGGTDPAGTGIRVTDNASPTILNNIMANLATGIVIDSTSQTTILGTSIYKGNTANRNVGSVFEDPALAIELVDTDPDLNVDNAPLFTGPAVGNFYLLPRSRAIDASLGNLPERFSLQNVYTRIGVAVSDIKAPSRDIQGQFRADDADPTVSGPPGLGGNPFIDRGAIEHVDTAGPTAVLFNPVDNNVADQDPGNNQIHLLGANLSQFVIQLVDGIGSGIDDSSVFFPKVTLRRNGILLTPGFDYSFVYDNNNDVIRLIAAAGVWLNGNQYDIAIDNGIEFDPLSSGSDAGVTPVGIKDLAGNFVKPNRADGTTGFTIVLDSVDDDAPVVNAPGPQSIYEDFTLRFHNILNPFNSDDVRNGISVFDVDAAGNDIVVTISSGEGTFTTTAPPNALVNITGEGTSIITLTGPIGTLINPILNAALEGLVFTPTLNFNGGATITIVANDQGFSGPNGPKSTTATVSVNVIAVNDDPENTLPVIQPQVTQEDVPLVFSTANGNLISIADLDVGAGVNPMLVTVSVANGSLTLSGVAGLTFTAGNGVDDASMTFRGTIAAINAALDGMTYTPPLNFNGPTSLQVNTNDQGNIGVGFSGFTVVNPFVLSDTDTLPINVLAVNDAPVNTVPGAQTALQDTPLIFSNLNSNQIAISDLDAASNTVQVTLTATDGTITLSGTGGLTFTGGSNGSATMTFTGTVAAINTALNGLRFDPTFRFFSGPLATLTIVTNDLGNVGINGPLSDTDTIDINVVQAVNDAPVVTVPPGVFATDEDVPFVFSVSGGLGITVSDSDVAEGSGVLNGQLSLALNATNGILNLGSIAGVTVTGGANGTASLTIQGLLANVNAALNGLTFSPALNYNGPATIQLQANDLGNAGSGGAQVSTLVTINLIVNGVQDAPMLDASGAPFFDPIPEDLAAGSNTGTVISVMLARGAGGNPITDADPGAMEGIAVTGLTGTSSGQWQYSINGGSVWTALAAISTSNAKLLRDTDRIRFLPNPNFNGDVTLTFKAWDRTTGVAGGSANVNTSGGATAFSSGTETAIQSVTPVNDRPSFTAPTTLATLEDLPLQTVLNFASAISTGPLDEAGQTPVTFTVTNNDNSLFAVQPSIDSNGTLTYQSALNAFGVATLSITMQDTGGTANGGLDTSFVRQTVMTINGINDAPTLNPIADPAVLPPNAPLQTINLTGIGAGPNELQALTITATSSNTAVIPNPTVNYTSPNSTGTLTFTPVPGAEGSALITVTVTDNGGTSNGGVNTFEQTFAVSVSNGNAVPVAIPSTVTTAEDTAVTITLGGSDAEFDPLTAIIASLPSGGTLFQTSNGVTQGAAMTAPNTPVTDSLRRVIYVPNANQFGSPYDTFTFVVNDTRDSAPATITINVTSDNDQPTTTGLANINVGVNAPNTTINLFPAFADVEDTDSALTFSVSTDNPALFSSLTITGTNPKNLVLAYAANTNGTAQVTVTATDTGSPVKSVSTTFTVTINTAPVAVPDEYVLSLSVTSSATVSTGVLSNDVDTDGPLPLVAALVTPTTRGTVTLNANGTFSYTRGIGFQGLDRFSYRANDGLVNSAVVQVTVLSYDASIVRKLYLQVLGRAPDDSGLQFWTNRIQNGDSYGAVAEGIFESDERLNPIISQYYRDYLLREPDAAGLAHWRENIWKRDGGPENVISGMIGSPEFFQSAGGTNLAWVNALYLRLLGRPADTQGQQHWTGKLNSGELTREDVVLGFVKSDENFMILITGWFDQYLDRPPTANEMNSNLNAMRGGASHRQIQIGLINTNEYRNTPPPPAPGTVARLL